MEGMEGLKERVLQSLHKYHDDEKNFSLGDAEATAMAAAALYLNHRDQEAKFCEVYWMVRDLADEYAFAEWNRRREAHGEDDN